MKKIINILIMLLIINFITGCAKIYNTQDEVIYSYEDVKNILIRFHVLANSDSERDQELKLKIKDEIIKYLYPYLNLSKSLDESRKILREKEEDVTQIAKKIVKENGYNYSVKVQLGYENFPEKSYGNIVLPQGKYEAFKVIIGEGKGHNWWCVMFPPLCFTDETKKQVEEEESKEKIDEVIKENNGEEKIVKKVNKDNEEEKSKEKPLEEVKEKIKQDSTVKEDNKKGGKKIKVKSKVAEVFKELLK